MGSGKTARECSQQAIRVALVIIAFVAACCVGVGLIALGKEQNWCSWAPEALKLAEIYSITMISAGSMVALLCIWALFGTRTSQATATPPIRRDISSAAIPSLNEISQPTLGNSATLASSNLQMRISAPQQPPPPVTQLSTPPLTSAGQTSLPPPKSALLDAPPTDSAPVTHPTIPPSLPSTPSAPSPTLPSNIPQASSLPPVDTPQPSAANNIPSPVPPSEPVPAYTIEEYTLPVPSLEGCTVLPSTVEALGVNLACLIRCFLGFQWKCLASDRTGARAHIDQMRLLITQGHLKLSPALQTEFCTLPADYGSTGLIPDIYEKIQKMYGDSGGDLEVLTDTIFSLTNDLNFHLLMLIGIKAIETNPSISTSRLEKPLKPLRDVLMKVTTMKVFLSEHIPLRLRAQAEGA